MRRGRFLVVLVLFLAGMASNSSAALTPGTYDLLTLLSNGIWTEYYASGGAGSKGSIIQAQSSDGGEWSLLGVLQTVVDSDDPDWVFKTTYAIGDDPDTLDPEFGFAITISGAWGESIEVLQATATNYSKIDSNGKLSWYLTFTAKDKDNPSTPIIFTAEFDGAAPNAVYNSDYSDAFHGGSPLKTLTMTVTPIPAAAWLLAPGVIGLAVIRRRKNRN